MRVSWDASSASVEAVSAVSGESDGFGPGSRKGLGGQKVGRHPVSNQLGGF